ncbi:MAG TPA: hypothetical protein VFV05_25060 [Methylomirabilota bacterium]|nr:hypothetical protein [Methylomirabilota bacterium]
MDPRGFLQPAALGGIYVLLIGEDAETRATLREILRYCGALVQEARSVSHARNIMNETVPRILVLVLRTPAESAWEMVRVLRAVHPDDGGKIPIVGVGPRTLAGTARVNGLDGYVAEPVAADALCRMVAELTS